MDLGGVAVSERQGQPVLIGMDVLKGVPDVLSPATILLGGLMTFKPLRGIWASGPVTAEQHFNIKL